MNCAIKQSFNKILLTESAQLYKPLYGSQLHAEKELVIIRSSINLNIFRYILIHFYNPVHLLDFHMDTVEWKLIWKFHRQSTLCLAMEIEALQLYLFDVVDKKQG